MITAKYPTVCSRCGGGIDVDASIHQQARSTYHDGCQPEQAKTVLLEEGGQGGDGQLSARDQIRSRTRASVFAAKSLYAFSFADEVVAAEGGDPGLNLDTANRSPLPNPPDTFFQECTGTFLTVAAWEFGKRGLVITSKGTLRRLHRDGCNLDMVSRALQLAATNGHLNVGYVFKLCQTWATDPRKWELHRLAKRPIGPGSKWSENDIAELRELVLEEHWEIPEIAEAFRRTDVAVQNAITKHVPEMRGHRLYTAYPAPIPPLGSRFHVKTLSELRMEMGSM